MSYDKNYFLNSYAWDLNYSKQPPSNNICYFSSNASVGSGAAGFIGFTNYSGVLATNVEKNKYKWNYINEYNLAVIVPLVGRRNPTSIGPQYITITIDTNEYQDEKWNARTYKKGKILKQSQNFLEILYVQDDWLTYAPLLLSYDGTLRYNTKILRTTKDDIYFNYANRYEKDPQLDNFAKTPVATYLTSGYNYTSKKIILTQLYWTERNTWPPLVIPGEAYSVSDTTKRTIYINNNADNIKGYQNGIWYNGYCSPYFLVYKAKGGYFYFPIDRGYFYPHSGSGLGEVKFTQFNDLLTPYSLASYKAGNFNFNDNFVGLYQIAGEVFWSNMNERIDIYRRTDNTPYESQRLFSYFFSNENLTSALNIKSSVRESWNHGTSSITNENWYIFEKAEIGGTCPLNWNITNKEMDFESRYISWYFSGTQIYWYINNSKYEFALPEPYTDTLPVQTDTYTSFVINNQSQMNAGLTAARVNAGLGVVGGIANMGLGAFGLNMGLQNNSVSGSTAGGFGMTSGAMGIVQSIADLANYENKQKALMQDKKNANQFNLISPHAKFLTNQLAYELYKQNKYKGWVYVLNIPKYSEFTNFKNWLLTNGYYINRWFGDINILKSALSASNWNKDTIHMFRLETQFYYTLNNNSDYERPIDWWLIPEDYNKINNLLNGDLWILKI